MAVTGPGPRSSDRRTRLLLVAILALALGLRLWGLNWGLPWGFHWDEIRYVDVAQEMLRNGDPNPRYFKNPSLLTYLIAGELLLARALGPLAGPLGSAVPGSARLLARLDSALLGAASVAILFALGAALFSRRVGLLAALFLAVAFLHVRDSHYGVNDVPGTALLLASLYCDARLLRSPALRWYALAGLAGGLATSTKYNMGFFFVPLLAAHWLAARRTTDPSASSGQAGRPAAGGLASSVIGLRALLVAGAAGVAGYLVGTPYTVLDFGRFVEDFRIQSGYGDGRWLGQPEGPVPLLHLTSLLQGFGALPLALALAGLVLAWREQRTEVVLLLAFPLAYLAFLLPKALFFARFAIPLLPACCLLAAHGACGLADRLWPARPGSCCARGLAAMVVAALAQPLIYDLQHDRILLQADTRILANEWVQANLPPGSRLKEEEYTLRDLSGQSRTYTPNTAGLRIEQFMGNPEAQQARYFVDHNVQYVVTSSFAYGRYQLHPLPPFERAAALENERLHRSLEQQTQLVAIFGAGAGGREAPYSLEDTFTPFWNLWEYERTGPTIRIYSLAPLRSSPSR